MDRNCVMLNMTERKFMCIDEEAVRLYEFVEVGKTYHEAIYDINGDTNLMKEDFVLLLVHSSPFYVKKEFVCEVDVENNSTRSLIVNQPIFCN